MVSWYVVLFVVVNILNIIKLLFLFLLLLYFAKAGKRSGDRFPVEVKFSAPV